MNGFILLHRRLLDKPIWINSTPEQKTILITLLMMASHKEKEWEWHCNKFKIEPGQFVTSLDSIVTRCGAGVTIQNVRTALKRFEKLEFLTNESTKQGRLITIRNWRFYQDENFASNKQTNNDLTNDQQSTNKELTPINNVKTKQCKNNINNIYGQPELDRSVDIPPAEKSQESDRAQSSRKTPTTGKGNRRYEYTQEFEDFWLIYPRSADKVNAYKFWKMRLKEGVLVEELMTAARNYADYVKTRSVPEDRILHGKTFLGQARRYEEFTKGVSMFGKSTDDDRDLQNEATKQPNWDNFYKG